MNGGGEVGCRGDGVVGRECRDDTGESRSFRCVDVDSGSDEGCRQYGESAVCDVKIVVAKSTGRVKQRRGDRVRVDG